MKTAKTYRPRHNEYWYLLFLLWLLPIAVYYYLGGGK